MEDEGFEELLERLPAIAKAVNAFSSEAVQEQVFEVLIASFRGHETETPPRSTSENKKSTPKKARPKGSTNSDGTVKKSATKHKTKGNAHAIVPDLNLRPRQGKSLEDFVGAKAPKTNEEHFVVMIYYLRNELKLEDIGEDHIYTCFKAINRKVPAKLRTVLGNAARRKGWFSSPADNLQLTTHGENFVEHDLPAASKA